MRYAAILFLAMFAPLATAAEWHYLPNASGKNGIWFFDKQSIVMSGGIVNIWVEVFHSPSEVLKSKVRSQKLKYQIDCKRRTLQIMAGISYAPGGTVVKSIDQLTPQDVVPDSIGDSLAGEVCRAEFPTPTVDADGLMSNFKPNISRNEFVRSMFEILYEHDKSKATKAK